MAEQDLSEVLSNHGLSEHKAAIQGVASLGELLRGPEEKVEEVHELLEDLGADRVARRQFRKWVKQAREDAEIGPPPGSESGHFYGLTACLNDKDVTGVDDTTILRVDVDPFTKDSEGKPTSTLRMATGAVDMQVQVAANSPVPVVSLIGPTGVGKSFVTSFFMARDTAKCAWPVVAAAGAHVPTSAHVGLHRGATRLSSEHHEPLLLFDFEGEDGRTPKNLEEGSLRRLAAYLSLGLTEDALKSQMKATMDQRQHIVKEVLPPLAYLISDVVLFIDQVEPRRVERVERVRHFAAQAHAAVESLPWRPALVLVQNKWARGVDEEARYDITSEYEWMTDDLGAIFSRVVIMRIPITQDRHKFEDGVLALHRAVHAAALEVRAKRQETARLYAEPEFWFGLETLVEQLNARGASKISTGTTMSTAMSRKLASRDATDNAVVALQFLGPLPKDSAGFKQRVREVLGWYAYGLAGQARFQSDVQCIRDGLRSFYDKLMPRFQAEEPCTRSRTHDGSPYPCTQRRAGHGTWHRNPALIRVESKSLVKRCLWLTDQVPCTWAGSFASGGQVGFDVFEQEFDRYAEGMSTEDYQAAFAKTPAAKALAEHRKRDELQHVCLLCLRAESDLTVLPEPVCHHYLCRQCILVRKKLSQAKDEIICPLCARKSVMPGEQRVDRMRVLTLDGGGVRGLVEIHILQKLEERFAPLPLKSLFDLIVGTDTGGLVSLGLLAGEPLTRLQALIETLARDILDVSPITRAWCWATGTPACDTAAFGRMLLDCFQVKELQHYKGSLPYCCSVSVRTHDRKAVVTGNLPGDLSRHFPVIYGMLLRNAVLATTAAPTFFEAYSEAFRRVVYDSRGDEHWTSQTLRFVDGGVLASCPVRWAARTAEELQTSSGAAHGTGMEMLVSIGTGRQPGTPNVASNNVMEWAGEIIDMATDAEKQWKDFADEENMLKDVPNVRVNPPNLGAQEAFSSMGIQSIHSGMRAYFLSDEGKGVMERVFQMTYAKLWHVKDLYTLVAGSPVELSIKVRDDLRFEVGGLQTEELLKFVRARTEVGPGPIDMTDLKTKAREAFKQQPLERPLPGRFAYTFDGEERELEAGATSFTLAPASSASGDFRMPVLNVVWRAPSGDFSILGFPRIVRVCENTA